MFRFPNFIAAPAMVLLLSGTAHAALTADQVWQSWKDAGAGAGLTISAATEANSGGVLTLNGVSVLPPGETTGITLSDVTLTEEADGSVTIRPGASIGVAGLDEGQTAAITHDGLVLTAREGQGGGLVYDYAANALTVDVNASYDGYSLDAATPAQKVSNIVLVTLEGLAGTYSDTPGANRTFGLDLAAKKLAYDVKSDDPNLKLKSAQTSTTDDFTISGTFALPSTMSLMQIASTADFGTALSEGLAITLATKQGASTGAVTQEDAMMPYQMAMTAPGGEANFVFNKDSFSMQSTGGGLTLNITTPMAPAPIDVSSGPVAMKMLFPMMSGDTAGDYALNVNFSQLVLGDGVWGMFDPGAALKRDPLDLVIDVSGKAKIDMIAMMVADETGAAPPIPAPETLDIKSIALKVAGAALNANGAFTFDNSMGMPMPLGSADVSISGANGLIDGLIATGILSNDDAMGARMMMGAFMQPGAEPDSLTSKIEAKEGFAIFVNGQQVQ